MKTKVEYTFIESLLVRKFYGDTTIIELKASLMYMLEQKMINSSIMGIISDFSEASFNVQQEDLLQLKDIFLENHHLMGHLKFAQIIPTFQIVQTILFENDNKDIKSRSFSTFQAAERWMRYE